jgi:hypothetical protein
LISFAAAADQLLGSPGFFPYLPPLKQSAVYAVPYVTWINCAERDIRTAVSI